MLTVADIASMEGLEVAVVAGSEGLTREVRWLHASELSDPTAWLEGGERMPRRRARSRRRGATPRQAARLRPRGGRRAPCRRRRRDGDAQGGARRRPAQRVRPARAPPRADGARVRALPAPRRLRGRAPARRRPAGGSRARPARRARGLE